MGNAASATSKGTLGTFETSVVSLVFGGYMALSIYDIVSSYRIANEGDSAELREYITALVPRYRVSTIVAGGISAFQGFANFAKIRSGVEAGITVGLSAGIPALAAVFAYTSTNSVSYNGTWLKESAGWQLATLIMIATPILINAFSRQFREDKL